MSNKLSFLAIALALAALVSVWVAPRGAATAKKETTFERVLRTGTIRCGYPVWSPDMILDPNTKKLSGWSHDITEAVGEKLGLKIEWTEEVGWGTGEEGLLTGRYDMVCADICMDSKRSKAALFSVPITHNPNYVFVRKDDTRFDGDPAKLNDPSVKFAVLPNTILDYAVKAKYPKAGRMDVNSLDQNTDLVMAVVTKKADASVNLLMSLDQYNANNPQTQVKAIGDGIRDCAGSYQLPMGEFALKHMIDNAIAEINMGDTVRNILLKYMPDNRRYWRAPAMLYKE